MSRMTRLGYLDTPVGRLLYQAQLEREHEVGLRIATHTNYKLNRNGHHMVDSSDGDRIQFSCSNCGGTVIRSCTYIGRINPDGRCRTPVGREGLVEAKRRS